MIEIKVLSDKQRADEILKNYTVNNGIVMAATDKEEIIAYTVFTVKGSEAVIEHIVPEDDVMLADGMIRSTIHVALSRGAVEVYYGKNVSEKLLGTLAFVLDSEKRLLDSDKLYRACCCEK